MSWSVWLSVLNVPVLLSWGLMLLAPRTRLARWWLQSDAVPLFIGLVYAAIMLPLLPGLLKAFGSFEGIVGAFGDERLVFAGWIHYLAFDLLVGRVVLADAQRRGIPHLAIVPSLLATFLTGPFGYLLYALTRLAVRRAAGAVAPLPASPVPLS